MAKEPPKRGSERKVKGSKERPIRTIKGESAARPQKVVIDEIFDDGSVRLIVQRMNDGYEFDQYLDDKAWGKYRSIHVSLNDLGGLLDEEHHNQVREGRVFLIHDRVSHDVYKPFRKKVKERTLELLKKEGFTEGEVKRRPKIPSRGDDGAA